ncbi:MAG: serine/threonine protein kinase [Microcystis aeruginosa G13-07]|jgi:serine/threonine protein kinase|nr:serine/threonine protein kinase [Microcystis aeruginosa G13-07]
MLPGKILLQRYEILEPLGRGGFGNTYIAKDLQTNFLCVVKHLHPVSNEPKLLQEATRLFKIEAETLRKLSSNSEIPNIIDYFEEDQQFYLVQELIQGQTLTTKLQPNQPLPESAVVEILKEVLTILEYIHNLGVIHRDIKPDNLIVRQEDGKLVLIDFGSVKEFNPQQSQIISQTITVGTNGYMPIEQIKGKPHKNSDLYALGMIGIQAITGRHPLDLEENANGEIIWQPYAQVSPSLAAILDKMIQPNPQERYQSATEVLKALYPPPEPQLHLSKKPSQKIHKNRHQTTPVPPTSQFSTWLQSPTGKNVSFAIGLALVASIGVYYLGNKEKADKLALIEKTHLQLESTYNNHQYEECFKQAQEPETIAVGIPEEQLTEIMVKCGLAAANVLAEQLKFGEAMQKLQEIPQNTTYTPQLDKQADIWAQSILEQASQVYSKEGNLSEALEMIGEIPAKSSLREIGESLAREWTAESTRCEALLKKANLALEYHGYQEVVAYATEISRSTTSDYWLLQAKDLAEKARQGISKSNPSSHSQSRPRERHSDDRQDRGSGLEVPEEFR